MSTFTKTFLVRHGHWLSVFWDSYCLRAIVVVFICTLCATNVLCLITCVAVYGLTAGSPLSHPTFHSIPDWVLNSLLSLSVRIITHPHLNVGWTKVISISVQNSTDDFIKFTWTWMVFFCVAAFEAAFSTQFIDYKSHDKLQSIIYKVKNIVKG